MKKVVFWVIFFLLSAASRSYAADYTLASRLSDIPEDDAIKLKNTITACADIMSFDANHYRYDTLFKYVLYTHDNFRILTDIDDGYTKSGNVSLIRSEYVDYIMNNVFRITPEKPPVSSLMTRSFCYNDGYYLYTGGFDMFFATDVRALTGVYDLGGNGAFVTFTDIYYEGDTKTYENSFAVVRRYNDGYALLRLGMGEDIPPWEELCAYSPFRMYNGNGWNIGDTKVYKRDTKTMALPILAAVVIASAAGLTICIAILIRQKR